MDRVKSFYSKNREVSRLIIIMIAWLVFMLLTQAGKFFTGANFLTMAGQFPEYGLMALGGMLCMMTGGIDLSVVGTANMTTIISVYVMNWIFGVDGTMPAGFSVVIFLIAVLTGCVVGAFNGFLISELKVPPILATLGVNQLITGLCIVITGGSGCIFLPKTILRYFFYEFVWHYSGSCACLHTGGCYYLVHAGEKYLWDEIKVIWIKRACGGVFRNKHKETGF